MAGETIWVEFYDIAWDRIYQTEAPRPLTDAMKSIYRWSDAQMPNVRVAPASTGERHKLWAEEQACGEKDWRS